MDESAKWYRVKPSYPNPAGGFLAIDPRYPGELVDGRTAVRFEDRGDRSGVEIVPTEHVEAAPAGPPRRRRWK
jgi:hypothetical protein